MPYQSVTYNVMIASPVDVVAERNTVRQVLADWNIVHSQSRQIVLMPIGWETHSSPQMGDHPQSILNKQILQKSDLLVGVFWTHVGTPTDTYVSGSVEDFSQVNSSGSSKSFILGQQRPYDFPFSITEVTGIGATMRICNLR